MSYQANTWKSRQGSGLNRFQDQNGSYWEFTAAPAEITEAGTPFSAEWMNHLEQGVQQISEEYWNLGVAESIPSGANLNSYSTPGTYLSPSATVSGNIQNTPWTASGYKLVVQTNQSANYLCQIAYTGAAMKLRRSNAGEWSDWEEIYISSSNPSTQKTQRNNLGMIQELWSGSWSSGTITVPNLQNYYIYKVVMQDMGTAMICIRHGNFFRGMGGYTTATPTVTYYQMGATISGNNLTMVASNAMKANGDNTFSDTVITNIAGIC